MDHFSTLPDEIIAIIFRLVLADSYNHFRLLSTYKQLHLICRRWHSVCVNWAEHLPKQDWWFNIRIKGDGCTITPFERCPECKNYDGLSNGPKLTDLLRHFNTVNRVKYLIFEAENLVCTDTLLLHLIESRLTHCTHLAFHCDMSGVTEDVMETFFSAVADSKQCTNLEISRVKCAEEVFTDRTLAPFIASGVVDFFDIMWSTAQSSDFGITDETCAYLSRHLPQKWFAFRMGNSLKRISAYGVHQLIETYCSPDCSIKETSYLSLPSKLKSGLLKLRSSNKVEATKDKRWKYKRLSSHPFPEGCLLVTFDNYLLDASEVL